MPAVRPIVIYSRKSKFTGKGESIGEANRNAYDLIKRKRFPGLWYRDDIGNAYFS